jgi:hypothetical protein
MEEGLWNQDIHATACITHVLPLEVLCTMRPLHETGHAPITGKNDVQVLHVGPASRKACKCKRED